jgi:NAD(P)-dependent dehydrogenase (short-subunit alcohol dehydrogenase family)
MSTALVTGATQGLGLALARALTARGWSVVVTARTSDDVARTVRELHAERPGTGNETPDVIGVAGDVADAVHRREVVEAVTRLSGDRGLDLLVNNASTLGPLPLRPLRDLGADDLAAVLAVNVLGPQALVHDLLPAVEAAAGVVVSISSDAGVEHYETWGGYGASKAALDHLTLTLGTEVPGIRAYAVDPGDMRTRMHQDAFPGEDIGDRPLPEDVAVPGLLSLVDGTMPSGRYRAADLAASPSARSSSGPLGAEAVAG